MGDILGRLRRTWPAVITWTEAGPGRWAGFDVGEGGRRLVLVRGDRYVTHVIDERYADGGLQGDVFDYLEERFEDIAGG